MARRISQRFGETFHIRKVENRSWILIHAGNYAGDTTRGFKTHSHGCILIGKKFGIIKKQKAVLLSKITLNRLMKKIRETEAELQIIEEI